MILSNPHWLQSLLPARASVSGRERLRGSAGALIGIALTGFVSAFLHHSAVTALWLMAPMGASAVLLFGVPSSPLAQPWSIVGGNLVAALIGVTCAKAIDDPVLGAAAAIFFAVGAMFMLHCLHPPSGAVALTAVLGGADIHAAGYGFVLAPVALNTALLLFAAVAYNNATGRRYPHTQQQTAPQHPHQTTDGVPTERLGFTPTDLQAALKRYDQVLDVSVDDLQTLFHQTEMQAFKRRFGQTLCGDLMSRDVLAVEFATPLDDAWKLMHSHAVQALPVLNRARHVIGIVTRSDFLAHVDLPDHRNIADRLRDFLRRNPTSHSDRHEVVGQIMTAPVRTALTDTPAVELVPLMADVGLHHIPVVDDHKRLMGMVSQTDLIGALYEICLNQLNAAGPTPS
jgi:CBS domain-containing membrane protein